MKYKDTEFYMNQVANKLAESMNNSIASFICSKNFKELTAKEKKEAELREKKEKIRRAKKMTITVGEYEDLVEESYN